MLNPPKKGLGLASSFSNLTKAQDKKDLKLNSNQLNSNLTCAHERRISKSANSLAAMLKTSNRVLSFKDLLPESSQELLAEKSFKIHFKENQCIKEYYSHSQDYKDKKDQLLNQECMNIHHFNYKEKTEFTYHKNADAIFTGQFNHSKKRKVYLSTQLEKTFYMDLVKTLRDYQKKIKEIKHVFITQLISTMQSQTYLHFLFESYPTTLDDLISFDNVNLE